MTEPSQTAAAIAPPFSSKMTLIDALKNPSLLRPASR